MNKPNGNRAYWLRRAADLDTQSALAFTHSEAQVLKVRADNARRQADKY